MTKSKVIIMGKAAIGETIAAKLKDHDVIVIDDLENVINIDGVDYREKMIPSPSRASKLIMGMAMMFGMPGMKEPERPDVDIVSEFALIQQKKSNLSRSQRDWVVNTFKSKFERL